MKSFQVLMLPFLLSACATVTGPTFTEPAPVVADKGDVYLYRTSAIFAVGQSFSVSLDGEKVGDLYNGSYLWMRLGSGIHTVKVSPGGMAKTSEAQIKVENGKTSFHQYDFVTGPLANAFFIGAEVKQRDEATALNDLKELKIANAQPTASIGSKEGAFAAIEDVEAVPGLNDHGRAAYREWLTKKYPRAFVIAENGAWNSSWSKRTPDPTASPDPSERALSNCRNRGLKECKVYAVDGNVLWHPTPNK